MKSTSVYIREALERALSEDNYQAVAGLANTLQELPPESNGRKISKVLTLPAPEPEDEEQLSASFNKSLDELLNSIRNKESNKNKYHYKWDGSITGKAGKFKNRDDIHATYEYMAFMEDIVFPELEYGQVYCTSQIKVIFKKIADELDWLYPLDSVKVKQGGKKGKPKLQARWQTLLSTNVRAMIQRGHLETAPKPRSDTSNAKYYKIISPFAKNATQSQN